MKVKKRKGAIIGSVSRIDLPGFPRPKFAESLKFPNDMTQLSAQNVSELLGRYTQMLTYASEQHTTFSVKVLELETRLSSLGTRVFMENPKIAHLERWRRDQVVESDSRMFSLKFDLLEAKKAKEIGWMYVQNYERLISALSRELSRKLSMNDGQPKGKIYQ